MRLAEDLGRARAESAWQTAHEAELESRLKQLEQRVAALPAQRAPVDPEILSRLDRLLAEHERLPGTPPAVTSFPSFADVKTAVGAPPARVLASAEAPEDQLRSEVQRLRGQLHRSTGPLTREQNAALRLLLRPERQLDSENPWPAPWY